MRPLAEAPADVFASVDFVLTDMDDTLTTDGRLSAATWDALERLRSAGLRVVPVTAAPAGWCDQMVRMWPVDAVIGENGGVFFRRLEGRAVSRRLWWDEADLAVARAAHAAAIEQVAREAPFARLADDQPFRLASVAWARPADAEERRRLVAAVRAAGLTVTLNDLWVLGWAGERDKLSASRRFLAEAYGLDLDAAAERVAYSGDSANDAPMFAALTHTVGVANVIDHLADIAVPPRWITRGRGGAGFVEFADKVLAGRRAG